MSATYAQPGAKRQKVRETRACDSVDYFQGVEKLEYNNMSTASDTACYRHYHGGERVNGRTMDEWLRLSVSMTEFRASGADRHGRPTQQRPWDDRTNTLENHKCCIRACFDFCTKLGVKYWTAFDSDLLPRTESWEECRANWDEVVELIQELVQRTHVKPLWIAPDLHSHARYASGAITSTDATTFTHAATQIKKCLEISQRLNCECFLIWPYREGYDAIFKSDIAREIKLFAKLLKITADFKERLSYRCQMLLMPYYCNSCDQKSYFSGSDWKDSDRINSYMWDVTSCLFFLKNYNLDRSYKVCVPPGHEMYMANVYNMLGGVVITNEWDQYDSRRFTLMMKCIIDQGTCPIAGLNLKLVPGRAGTELKELAACYGRCVDAAARGLRAAANAVADQTLSKLVQQRYGSYYSGFGARIVSGDISMEECEEFYKKNQQQQEHQTPKSEQMEFMLQRYIDTCEQI